MNTEDLAFIAAHVSTIDGQRPERLDEVRDRIRIARRRRTTAVVAGTVTFAAAIFAIAAIVPGASDDSAPPVEQPPLPTVQPIEEPPGQTEFTAAFGPEDVVHGMEEIGSATSDPGATELHASLPYPDTPYVSIAGYCRGPEDVWWVIGGAGGTYGQCSPDGASDPTPTLDFQPLGNAPFPVPGPDEFADQETSVDMWLTGPLTARTRNCVEREFFNDTFYTDCLETNPDVTLVTAADATFGLTGYVHSAPLVVDDPLGEGFEALANIDGTEYQFTHGVASAPGADRLAIYLEPSEQPRLVLLVVKQFQGQPLLVDGEPASFPTDLGPGSAWQSGRSNVAARALVPPGSHNITAALAGNKKAELLVYQADTAG